MVEANSLKPIDEIRGDAKMVSLPLHVYLDHSMIERMFFWTMLKCRIKDMLRWPFRMIKRKEK